MLSKSLLEWPKEASAQPVSNGEVTSVVTEKPGNPLDSQAWALKDSDTFEARWRDTTGTRPSPSRGHPLNLAVRSAHREDLVGGSHRCSGACREGDRHDENARDLAHPIAPSPIY